MTATQALRGIAKTMLLWGHVLAYIVHLAVGSLLFRDATRRRRWRGRMTTTYCRAALRCLGFRVHVGGAPLPQGTESTMIVSNHMGYLDILVLSSVAPMVFITSVEVQRTPFLGLMATLGGSLFVERRHRSMLHRELTMIERTLGEGLPVVLFPEATSSNGSALLPFKASLLEVPCRLGADIVPLCVRYERINNAPPTAQSRDLVAYYGDLSFFPHFLKLPFVNSVEVSVSVLPTVSAHDRNRKELCAQLQRMIGEAHAAEEIGGQSRS